MQLAFLQVDNSIRFPAWLLNNLHHYITGTISDDADDVMMKPMVMSTVILVIMMMLLSSIKVREKQNSRSHYNEI